MLSPGPRDSRARSPSFSQGPKVSIRGRDAETAAPASDVAARTRRPTRVSTMPNFGAVVMLRGRFSHFRQTFAARRQPTVVKYENTFRMDPQEGTKFRSDQAKKYCQRSLNFFLDGLPYNPKAAARLAKSISEDIRRKVKENLQFKRYKLVCYVMIAENCGQTLQGVHRACLNTAFDSWCSAEYKSEHMLASAVLYAVYTE